MRSLNFSIKPMLSTSKIKSHCYNSNRNERGILNLIKGNKIVVFHPDLVLRLLLPVYTVKHGSEKTRILTYLTMCEKMRLIS